MTGRKVGYTTGVFDMFHIGHLRILQRAREACDHLIVGVTTDGVCLERKQKSPIVPGWERMEIVKSIRCVDEVVPEDNLDKLAAWEKLKFNIIFKGDDWRGTPLWTKYEGEFASRGVEVMYFSYTGHTSSTLLRQTLHDHLDAKLKEERN